MTSHERTPDQVGLKPSWTGDHLRVLDDDDVVHLLRAAVEREGSQAAFAKRYGLDRVSMNSMLNGKRRVSATVLKAFGLRKVYVIDDYEVLSGLGVSNLSHDASGRQAGCEAALASGRRSRAVTRVFPSLAQSGHFETEFRRPLLGEKRTSAGHSETSTFDPSGHWPEDCHVGSLPRRSGQSIKRLSHLAS